jgi:hypothetical protein
MAIMLTATLTFPVELKVTKPSTLDVVTLVIEAVASFPASLVPVFTVVAVAIGGYLNPDILTLKDSFCPM